MRFLQWLTATRYSHVENLASSRKLSMVLKTVMNTSCATSSASARLPSIR